MYENCGINFNINNAEIPGEFYWVPWKVDQHCGATMLALHLDGFFASDGK